MRTRYKTHDSTSQYFITSTIVKWIPVFNNKHNLDALIEAITYSQQNKGFNVFDYVIIPEHFHLICSSEKLVSTIQSIKSYTAKRIIDTYKSENNVMILEQFIQCKKEYKTESKYQVWHEGFKPKEILSEDMFKQKSDYIHFNPVKRGIVESKLDYESSSARDYFLRMKGRIIIDGLDYEN